MRAALCTNPGLDAKSLAKIETEASHARRDAVRSQRPDRLGPRSRQPRIPRSDGHKKNLHRPGLHLFHGLLLPAPNSGRIRPASHDHQSLGRRNLAYLFALSQFFMAWIIAGLYVRAGDRFDALSRDIIEAAQKHDDEKGGQ